MGSMSAPALTSIRQLEVFRKKYRDGKLPAAVDAELTRTNGPDWAAYRDSPSNEQRWLIKAKALKTFRDDNGRWPVETRSGAEPALAEWRQGQRRGLQNGRLRHDRKEWLNENIPGWADIGERVPPRSPRKDHVWQENAKALKAFRASHRRWRGDIRLRPRAHTQPVAWNPAR